MRIAFLGTPAVAVPCLEALVAAEDVEVATVITNPDRAKGRSKRPVPPPVKVAAEAAGLPVWQPRKPREVLDDLRALEVDACAVVAYGALLPRDVLDAGGRGFVNLHFSLLPRWRGAAPVQHAIRSGDTETGVTTFVLNEGMDTGPIIDQVRVPIDPAESAGELLERLAVLGAPVLVESLRALVSGVTPQPQPGDGATLAPKIAPEDVEISFAEPVRAVIDLVRSADPAPGAHTRFRNKRLKVLRASPADREPSDAEVADERDVVTEVAGNAAAGNAAGGDDAAGAEPPGTVVAVSREGAVVACGDGAIRLDVVQPEGKGRMDGAAFANGYRPEVGERLGPTDTDTDTDIHAAPVSEPSAASDGVA